MAAPSIPLSVLDLAPVPAGTTAASALQNSIDLARHVEPLGYTRHWVAEHHNMAGIASSSPAVLMAHLAAATSTMRIGSGGVMLPNHASLTIAEQFGMLEALHPGRIDLGLGRAPGTDQNTAAALRRTPLTVDDSFPYQLGELLAYFAGTHPEILATTAKGYRPALWMLGSSEYGAQMAGQLGVPYSFAHHFSMGGTEKALEAYRKTFEPSEWLEEPYSMIGVGVICAETSEQAEYLAGPSALSFTQLRQGRPMQMVRPEEVAAHEWTPAELELRQHWEQPVVKGDAEAVRTQLEELVERYGVDELMLTTMVYDHADRRRSYELVAEAWELPPPVATA
jgi:luciferase family oxidoreductase group 1